MTWVRNLQILLWNIWRPSSCTQDAFFKLGHHPKSLSFYKSVRLNILRILRVALIESPNAQTWPILLVLSIQLNLTLKRFQLQNVRLSLFLSDLIGVWIIQSKHVCFPFTLHEAGFQNPKAYLSQQLYITLLRIQTNQIEWLYPEISPQRFLNFYCAKRVANVKFWANQGQRWNKSE